MKALAFLVGLTVTVAPAARAEDAQAAAGRAAFATCAVCHSAEKGRIVVGPPLFGVVGRKAGTVPGFSYSKAMAASGITWDATSIDAFITSPQAKVPGTRMPFAGLKDPIKRAAIVAYLTTLHD